MIGNSDDETNFPHKLSLTNRQVANLRKTFANHSSTDIKLLKTQLSKLIQLGGHLILLKIQNMMGIKEDYLLWFKIFLIKH